MSSKTEIIEAAQKLFQAEQTLIQQSTLVMGSFDISVERSFDEDELEDAVENFKALFENYIQMLIQHNDTIDRETAIDLYVDAKSTTFNDIKNSIQSDPTVIFEQKMDEIFDSFIEALETRSDTTHESSFSDEEKMPQGVQTLRRKFEKKLENPAPISFKERALAGKNVTREVNKIEAGEHSRKYKEEIKAHKQNQYQRDKEMDVENGSTVNRRS